MALVDATLAADGTDLSVHIVGVFQMASPLIEPQEVPTRLRHYFIVETQLTHCDRFLFFFSRGTPQVIESFEMLSNCRGLSGDEFEATPHAYMIINTNSPRRLDIPMAQGQIDFARHGQLSIITPFTMMGAMARSPWRGKWRG